MTFNRFQFFINAYIRQTHVLHVCAYFPNIKRVAFLSSIIHALILLTFKEVLTLLLEYFRVLFWSVKVPIKQVWLIFYFWLILAQMSRIFIDPYLYIMEKLEIVHIIEIRSTNWSSMPTNFVWFSIIARRIDIWRFCTWTWKVLMLQSGIKPASRIEFRVLRETTTMQILYRQEAVMVAEIRSENLVLWLVLNVH